MNETLKKFGKAINEKFLSLPRKQGKISILP